MPDSEQHALRAIPAVEKLLRDPGLVTAAGSLPPALVTGVVRDVLADVRAGVLAGGGPPDVERIKRRIQLELALFREGRPARVINATGIVLHTNLGRAVLGERVGRRLAALARGYCELELDVARGARGRRDAHVELVLRVATSAEGALVVNNCAAAVLLVLDTFARGREVIVSRGELVEIGGSFRIPDVLERSGARLVEIGTTNKTRLADYRRAITSETAVLLKVHRSNFHISGFTEEASTRELAALAESEELVMVRDLGSGEIGHRSPPDVLSDEPTLTGELTAGAHVVAASGDKLLGGPQSGLIVGRRDHVDRCRSNPLYRALRPDKLALAALVETLLAHLGGQEEDLPARRMMRTRAEPLERRARAMAERLTALGAAADVAVEEDRSEIGGGAAPAVDLATHVVTVRPRGGGAHRLESTLRLAPTPILVRVRDDRVVIDPRTLLDGEDEQVTSRVADALASAHERAEGMAGGEGP